MIDGLLNFHKLLNDNNYILLKTVDSFALLTAQKWQYLTTACLNMPNLNTLMPSAPAISGPMFAVPQGFKVVPQSMIVHNYSTISNLDDVVVGIGYSNDLDGVSDNDVSSDPYTTGWFDADTCRFLDIKFKVFPLSIYDKGIVNFPFALTRSYFVEPAGTSSYRSFVEAPYSASDNEIIVCIKNNHASAALIGNRDYYIIAQIVKV